MPIEIDDNPYRSAPCELCPTARNMQISYLTCPLQQFLNCIETDYDFCVAQRVAEGMFPKSMLTTFDFERRFIIRCGNNSQRMIQVTVEDASVPEDVF